LIARFKRPLVSTSANISGDATPKSFPAIPDRIKTGVDLVVPQEFDNPVSSKPSSVIRLGLTGEIEIIRH
ncbi:MAG TPA: Sua5/YciO/YrdC/YwlC family protein, partial [Tenuifilaceae bacterium]|nr:Sua5/YciO/YrdC/YwlC family protein [Tenuifilaceae bacterium]